MRIDHDADCVEHRRKHPCKRPAERASCNPDEHDRDVEAVRDPKTRPLKKDEGSKPPRIHEQREAPDKAPPLEQA